MADPRQSHSVTGIGILLIIGAIVFALISDGQNDFNNAIASINVAILGLGLIVANK
jgi:hypothetical protein